MERGRLARSAYARRELGYTKTAHYTARRSEATLAQGSRGRGAAGQDAAAAAASRERPASASGGAVPCCRPDARDRRRAHRGSGGGCASRCGACCARSACCSRSFARSACCSRGTSCCSRSASCYSRGSSRCSRSASSSASCCSIASPRTHICLQCDSSTRRARSRGSVLPRALSSCTSSQRSGRGASRGASE